MFFGNGGEEKGEATGQAASPFLVDLSVKVVGDASPRDSHGGNRLFPKLTLSRQR